jgi:uncharacterized protein (UPF0262 family)
VPGAAEQRTDRLARVTLEDSLARNASVDIAHEREVAIYDLLSDNRFRLQAGPGPYHLHLAIVENRLVFELTGPDDGERVTFILSMGPFRRIVRDYFVVCESYYQAIKTAPPSHIEAIDMGRRSLHDEGSRVLQERLAGKASMDFRTARRLFTLICALHRRP